MAFYLPNFNLLASAWTCDGTEFPDHGAADWADLPCQKYIASSRLSFDVTPPNAPDWWQFWVPPVQLRFPMTGPFAGGWSLLKVSCVEVPQGSGQYYRTQWADTQHEGFPNQYMVLIGVHCGADGKAHIPPLGPAFTGIGTNVCGD